MLEQTVSYSVGYRQKNFGSKSSGKYLKMQQIFVAHDNAEHPSSIGACPNNITNLPEIVSHENVGKTVDRLGRKVSMAGQAASNME